ALRFVDETRREKRASAAERPRRIGRAREVNAVARGFEHGKGRARILGLEITVESVDEKQDFAAPPRPRPLPNPLPVVRGEGIFFTEIIAAPLRQRALRGKADERLADRRHEICYQREACRPWRVARQ